MGDRQANIRAALQAFEVLGIQVQCCSSIIETDPVGGPDQGKYLNAVCQVHTTLSPQILLKVFKNIEKDLGRQEGVRNGPRPIDCDILLYDDIILNSPALIIPHPRMGQRDFVMKPLQEIFPNVCTEFAHACH